MRTKHWNLQDCTCVPGPYCCEAALGAFALSQVVDGPI